ncbi:MAG: helix-turn-helix domain-containing protein [Clostridiales bacterium]|jgi:repressor LexA|nr:helix-turn-helix domain-containing protein [Clostridiales bacterium]
MSTFGEKLRKIRKERKMSQEELAAILGTSKQVISRYEKGQRIPKITTAKQFALSLGLPLEYLAGDELNMLPPEAVPYQQGRRLPILGSIRAGAPLLADEQVTGYDYADVPESADWFFLRVRGDSMINAGIAPGDLVLVRKQDTAENGEIAVCLVNSEEATLKRFHRQGDIVVLQPENPAYSPIIVPVSEFDSGNARIIGVAREVRRSL